MLWDCVVKWLSDVRLTTVTRYLQWYSLGPEQWVFNTQHSFTLKLTFFSPILSIIVNNPREFSVVFVRAVLSPMLDSRSSQVQW